MRIFSVFVIFMLLVSGCSKTSEQEWDHFYNYFPATEGHWVIYQVDSVAYNKLLDTVIHYSYFVRETIGESFTDLSGQQWQRIDHEIRHDSSSAWLINAAYAQTLGKRTAERTENNLRFIKLIFPFRTQTYWQGNSYINYQDIFNCNFYGDWNYQYKELFVERTVNVHTFDSVVVVQQVADSGLICKSLAVEMYAPGIGLIHKRVERLTTQNTSSDPFYMKAEDGYILIYNIIDWRRD